MNKTINQINASAKKTLDNKTFYIFLTLNYELSIFISIFNSY